METGKNLYSQQFVEEAIDNVRKDRAMASTLLVELVKILKTDETKHQYSGPVAAKYLETLQRSNEQLVKLASLLSKKEGTVTNLSQLEKSEIYENNSGVTAFIMDNLIDTGDIIYKKYFQKPSHEYLDEVYDPYIRSETLIELLTTKKLQFTDLKKQESDEGETYFVIHPTLKHIAILSCTRHD